MNKVDFFKLCPSFILFDIKVAACVSGQPGFAAVALNPYFLQAVQGTDQQLYGNLNMRIWGHCCKLRMTDQVRSPNHTLSVMFEFSRSTLNGAAVTRRQNVTAALFKVERDTFGQEAGEWKANFRLDRKSVV